MSDDQPDLMGELGNISLYLPISPYISLYQPDLMGELGKPAYPDPHPDPHPDPNPNPGLTLTLTLTLTVTLTRTPTVTRQALWWRQEGERAERRA